MRNRIVLIAAVVMLLLLSACAKKAPEVSFTDLKLGVSKEEVTKLLGDQYETVGTQPQRMVYTGLKLFDFIEKKSNTRLDVYLNLSSQTYSYSYYIYDALDGNMEKAQKFFSDRYGAGTENAAGGTDYAADGCTYTVMKTDEFVAVSVY